MIILNTRPADQAIGLTQRLEALGHQVVCLPLFQIKPISLNNETYVADIAIFVSQNAVTHFFAQASLQAKQVFAVGSSTAKALKQNGIEEVLSPAVFSSEGLLAMPGLRQVKNQHVLIIAGENSKPLLRETLTQRGALVAALACYKRVPLRYTEQQLSALDAVTHIVVTSSESLRALLDLFEDKRERLLAKTLCVISDAMREMALKAGFTKVIKVDSATDAAISALF